MTDLQTRFRTLDELKAPELWHEAERRAAIAEPRLVRLNQWVFFLVVLMLALVAGAVAVIGSHSVRLPLSVDATSIPSTRAIVATPLPTARVPSRPTWTSTGSMLEARTSHTATLLADGKVLVAGGYNGSTYLAMNGYEETTELASVASAELFDPRSGSWTATGSMLEARAGHTATLLADGRVLVVGGSLDAGGSSLRQHAELYDPATGTWSAAGELCCAYWFEPTTMLLADGRVLLGLGHKFAIYDPGTGTWAGLGYFDGTSWGAAATTVLPDGTVLVAGGVESTYDDQHGGGERKLASAQLFDPVSTTWTPTGSMRDARSHGVATLLPDGTVLVAGGFGPGGPTPFAELFDPASGSWTATASMDMAVGRGGMFTVLQDGSVLALGRSEGGSVAAFATPDLYDPVSGTWTMTASMDGDRAGYTATRLADGTVLVVGGFTTTDAGGKAIPMNSAEAYDSGSGN